MQQLPAKEDRNTDVPTGNRNPLHFPRFDLNWLYLAARLILRGSLFGQGGSIDAGIVDLREQKTISMWALPFWL